MEALNPALYYSISIKHMLWSQVNNTLSCRYFNNCRSNILKYAIVNQLDN